MNNKRSGIWISVELMTDKHLDWTNKALMTEILSLHKLPKGCRASNEQFAELLGIKKSATSKRISKLKNLGYIQTKDVFERNQCIGRIITPIKYVSIKVSPVPSSHEANHPDRENKENINNAHSKASIRRLNSSLDLQTESSNKNHTPLTEVNGGSSSITIGVVPKQPWGSSQMNTNNTFNNTYIKEHLINQYTGENESSNSVEDLNSTKGSSIINSVEKFDATPTGNYDSDITCKPNQPKISIKEYRVILDHFFGDYSSWEADLLRLGIEEFIRSNAYYHSNKPEYIGMIREFYEL